MGALGPPAGGENVSFERGVRYRPARSDLGDDAAQHAANETEKRRTTVRVKHSRGSSLWKRVAHGGSE
jgi:hypothetical protein